MDLDFSPEDTAFRKEVRHFLDENLPEHLREGARATPGVFVEPDIGSEWQAILHRKGWLAYNWPVECGGTGWTPIQRYIFEKECALADAPSLPVLSLKLLGPVICRFGTAEQKAHILPRILDGTDFWCQGFSEPGSGSDLASLKTRAERQGDHYVINGQKIWTTHAHHANRIFCLVKTSQSEKPQRSISFLLVDMDQPGIEVRPIIGLAGDHEVNEVYLDDVRTPVDHLVGEEGQGWTIAKFLLENERGGACHAPKLLSDLSRIRAAAKGEPDGRGGCMADDRTFMARLARIELEAQALEMTELRVLAEMAKGLPPGPQTSLSKMVASTLRQQVDALAMHLYGHAGLALETRRPLYGDDAPQPLYGKEAQLAAPRYLNSRAWTIFGGTNEIQRTIIAKTVLGL
ncbi:acyl-CoA dehydrogenase [Sphingobium jiangsuense]|uniref:Alkylation response protein AidB-like acyl-CoA dehydrogenase n=1 Tax=Sphingobium jiangsuense TaxID=870476 RepID=A0A7W6BKV8_9SPHN|nr:acyl-CoA dehydrogenase family protein [Sphingobium jiangsuense]MBB3926811.1 alkylation response protein AidB-like acyl-CoA dehydrogenase [Sphingobium jiangsuense]GLS98818.1 acyl-CoA dehydrogenase [Sphingobium jiangsuense]